MAKHIPHRLKKPHAPALIQGKYEVTSHSLDPKTFEWNTNHKACHGTGLLGYNKTFDYPVVCKCVKKKSITLPLGKGLNSDVQSKS